MATKTFLHVGLPKSGTTYLQAVLAENRARLADRAALLFPGRTWHEQVRAVRDVRGQQGRGGGPGDAGAWDALVTEIAAWPGDAVVSMEWLGGAPTEQVATIVDSLAPSRVEVIVTARDLARTIPAAWQEYLQNGEVWTWPEFLRSVSSEHPRATPAGNQFWAQQDLGKILATWRDRVPAERLNVVTLPQSGAPAGELWSRFAQVLGIDGALFDASGRGSNESLGRESAELMLRLNRACRAHQVDWKTYEAMFKQSLAKGGLAKRKHLEQPQRRIPAELEPWTLARTAEQIRSITASGARVVGDLADLEPDFGPAGDDGDPSAEDVLAAAVDGLVTLGKAKEVELDRLRRRNDQLKRRSGRVEERAVSLPERGLRKASRGARRVGRSVLHRVRKTS